MLPQSLKNKEALQSMTNREEIDKYFEDQAHFYITKKKLETIDNFNGIFDFLNEGEFAQQQNFETISMGMSGDYKIAIEEGSSMIRVGSKIFGKR